MAEYIVKDSQNLFDIALHLYGTIEGMFDLFISNQQLSMTDNLRAGQKLIYHEDFIVNYDMATQITSQNITPINGERQIYHKSTTKPLRVLLTTPSDAESCQFSISGEKNMIVDWGDNTPLEQIELTHIHRKIQHFYNNKVDERQIKLYGDFSALHFDLSELEGDFYPITPITVDEFTFRNNDRSLTGLFLFDGTYKVDLQRNVISDLSSIYNMSLSQLNLSDVKFTETKVLDDYLINLVENHQNRRACEVWLTTEPTEVGMEAIETIINEPEWNTPHKWVFHINQTDYTAE